MDRETNKLNVLPLKEIFFDILCQKNQILRDPSTGEMVFLLFLMDPNIPKQVCKCKQYTCFFNLTLMTFSEFCLFDLPWSPLWERFIIHAYFLYNSN